MMFKKTILAVGLASITASVAHASTLEVSGANANKAQKAVGITIGGALREGTDVIDLAAGAADGLRFDVKVTGNTEGAYANSLKHIDIVLTNGSVSPASNVVASWVNASGTVNIATPTYPNSNTIRLISTPSDASDAIVSGATLAVSGLKVLPQTIETSGTVGATVTAVSTVADGAIDTATAVLATYINEFVGRVSTKLDGVIDVGKDQVAYTTSIRDIAGLTIENFEADQYDVISATGIFTFSGDFAFLDTDGDGTLEAKEGSLTTSSSMTLTKPAKALNAVSGSIAGIANGTSTALLLVNASALTDALVITPQIFTGSIDAEFTRLGIAKAAKVSVASGLALGQWTLNAASNTVDLLPFGPGLAHSIAVINPGKVDAEISITLTGNGTSVTEKLGVMAKAQSATEIGSLVSAIAATGGMTLASVTVVVDAKNVKVKGLYYSKADGDRVLMTTTKN